MPLTGMDGGESLRGGAGMLVLAALCLWLGALAIGAASEGAWQRAILLTLGAAAATGCALGGQAFWSRRRSTAARGFYAALAGIPALMVGLLALLFAAGHTVVGEWGAAAYGAAVAAAAVLAGWLAWLVFLRSKARVLPPFHPLTPATFAEDLDPPAYPPPRELAVRESRSPNIWLRLWRAFRLNRP